MRLQLKDASARSAEDSWMAKAKAAEATARARLPTAIREQREKERAATGGRSGTSGSAATPAGAMGIAARWVEPPAIEDRPGITVRTIALENGSFLRIPLADHRIGVRTDGRGLLQQALEEAGPRARLLSSVDEDGAAHDGGATTTRSRARTPVARGRGGDSESEFGPETPGENSGALVVTGPGALVPADAEHARGALAGDSLASSIAALVPAAVGAPGGRGGRRRFGEEEGEPSSADPLFPERPQTSETAVLALGRARSVEHSRRVATGAIPDAGAHLLSRARAALRTPGGLVGEGARAPAAVSRLAAEERAILRAARDALRNHQLAGQSDTGGSSLMSSSESAERSIALMEQAAGPGGGNPPPGLRAAGDDDDLVAETRTLAQQITD